MSKSSLTLNEADFDAMEAELAAIDREVEAEERAAPYVLAAFMGLYFASIFCTLYFWALRCG